MKRSKLLISIFLLINVGMTNADCFIVVENNKVLKSQGNCESRYSPCSTFKIAISLMAYEERFLIDELNPVLKFKSGYLDDIDSWKQDHNPKTWMKHSCVWFSQLFTQSIGVDKFKEYLAKFSYGNQDVTGDAGKNNGLTNSWLSSSLEISPSEQVKFLHKLINNKLPVSRKSHELTRNILFIEDLPNGWKLYGKTGNGSLPNKDRTVQLDQQIGWFVGWVQKDERSIIFVKFIQDKNHQDTYASLRAKAIAKQNLLQIISALDLI